VRNAADAALSPDAIDGCAAHVDISWQTVGAESLSRSYDNGPGLTNAAILRTVLHDQAGVALESAFVLHSRSLRRIEDPCSWQTNRRACRVQADIELPLGDRRGHKTGIRKYSGFSVSPPCFLILICGRNQV